MWPPPPPSSNAVPTVSLIASTNSVNTGQPSMLTATASDSDGTIAKVSFYNFGILLAEVTTAPYTYAFTSTNTGVFAINAVATDDKGATGSSNSVSITVGGGVIVPGNVSPTVSMSTVPASVVAGAAVRSGAAAFLYLEVLDASFSLDGVIGAFALSNNLFVIAIGLTPVIYLGRWLIHTRLGLQPMPASDLA